MCICLILKTCFLCFSSKLENSPKSRENQKKTHRDLRVTFKSQEIVPKPKMSARLAQNQLPSKVGF